MHRHTLTSQHALRLVTLVFLDAQAHTNITTCTETSDIGVPGTNITTCIWWFGIYIRNKERMYVVHVNCENDHWHVPQSWVHYYLLGSHWACTGPETGISCSPSSKASFSLQTVKCKTYITEWCTHTPPAMHSVIPQLQNNISSFDC